MLKSTLRQLALLPLLAVLPFTAHVTAQTPTAPASPATWTAAGCGVDQIHYHVKRDKHAQPVQPEPGKAIVYFIENDDDFNMVPMPTTRVGIDGQWVGATEDKAYVAFLVDPGPHHLCASWQSAGDNGSALISGAYIGYPSKAVAIVFTAQPGGVYYFLDKNFYDAHDQSDNRSSLGLSLLDAQQGSELIRKASSTIAKAETGKDILGGLIKEKK